jgi:hypothetical protein
MAAVQKSTAISDSFLATDEHVPIFHPSTKPTGVEGQVP